jgi:hypothetical protein
MAQDHLTDPRAQDRNGFVQGHHPQQKWLTKVRRRSGRDRLALPFTYPARGLIR